MTEDEELGDLELAGWETGAVTVLTTPLCRYCGRSTRYYELDGWGRKNPVPPCYWCRNEP